MRVHVAIRLLALAFAVGLCSSARAQDDPMQAAIEQAAVLEAAPELSAGTLALDEAALEGGAFVWIAPEQGGLYTLSTSTPGALVLGSIPTIDGRYDGTTAAQQHGASMSQTEAPSLGPLLLSAAHPYLLSVSSSAGATTLALTLVEPVPEQSPTPADDATVPGGSTLYAPDARMRLVVPGADTRRRIEVIAEPRADLSAELGGQSVPAGGRYPWLSPEDTPLSINAKWGESSPPPRVLVRLVPAEIALDEAEPNEKSPNPLSLATPFEGHLLHDDEDWLTFSLESDTHLSLGVTSGVRGTKFSARIQQVREKDTQLLWSREPGGAGIAGEHLTLPAGTYRLELERTDGKAEPLPYTVSLETTSPPAANDEVEPNDTPAAAMPMPGSLRVSGSAAEDDLDIYRFTVPNDKAQHLWRVFTVDASRIDLSGDDGHIATMKASGRRTTVDSLALEPGDYQVKVWADGDYLLRVMDLGPRPRDYEGEPNDKRADGQRIGLGQDMRGGFHRDKDSDYYLFQLDVPSPVEINIRPVGDGPMGVWLYLDGSQWGNPIEFDPESGPYTFRAALPAGDWALQAYAQAEGIQNQYELSVDRLPALAGHEPDDDPLDAAKLPRDGDIADSVGGFEGRDQVFIPLPEGEGVAAMVCAHDADTRPGRWRLYHWSDDSAVGEIVNGIAIFPYNPDLGGAVRFELSGTRRQIAYQCSLRFPPIETPPAGEPQTQLAGEPTVLSPGETRRLTVDAEGPEPRIALDVEEGTMAFVTCRDGAGNVLAQDSYVWELDGVSKPTKELLGDLQPFVAETDSSLGLSRRYAERYREGTLPLDVDCTLYGVDDLPRPADMGPPAEFRIFERTASAEGDAEAKPPGPPPPGLEALIARDTPDHQPEGTLPVTITFEELPELAAFNEAGQRFEATVKLSNDSNAALPMTVSVEVNGEGWRVEPPEQTLTLQPNTPASMTLKIVAPPWLSPSLSPGLVVRAEAGDTFAAGMEAFRISASAVPVAPFTYWHAPDALRGGLNVLHYGLGARLIEWGDEIPDENTQSRERMLHDGLAPHIESANTYKNFAFKLAATAEVAGVMIQLRSTAPATSWPAEVEVFAPAAGGGWERVAASALETVHAPQYLVFDAPVTTDRLRFQVPRCQASCTYPYIQEIQAISTPGTHPEDLPPINAADPEVGGHVVWSTQRFRGSWNSEFLVGEPSASNQGWPRAGAEPIRITVAFHQNRAALVRSIVWVGDPDDTVRISEARLEASVTGPNGPWTVLGTLPAPPLDEIRSSLDFKNPVWVRYLRFTFEVPQDGRDFHYGPDAIEVIESPGTSVIGLWEDDLPRAAYEALTKAEPPAAVPPVGGPSREKAVALAVDRPTQSSVVIEHNEDWWRIEAADGPLNGLRLEFERDLPLVVPELYDAEGTAVTLEESGGPGELKAALPAGTYYLRIFEPPRSVVITWDTSGSVAHYIPRTLAAVRTWGRGLKPGRDALQLLPFGVDSFLLENWAETPEALEPALTSLPEEESSKSENALMLASQALAERRGSRGIVVMTDAQTGMEMDLWPAMLQAMPRVVSLSVDSDSRQNAAVMMDWASVNGGHFQRVIGPLGLADSMELANALFRAPKAYTLTASLEELVEVEGEAKLTISASGEATASGAVELILDASGSMLQRMEGRRRIDVAHEALVGLVQDTLPEGTPFAFRAFGLEEDACKSELIVPLGPLNREAAAKAIEDVPAINLAKTAIADSLRAAASDLADSAPPRVVVLVTDGEETCEGDPEAAIAELRESGLDARVNIVGFAIDDEALAETFSAWAESGGGTYFDARGAEALEQSIADALKPRFDITRTYLDGRTEIVGRLALGDTMTVPAGQLTIAPGSGASGEAVTLQVQPDGSVALDYAPESGLTPTEKMGSE